MRDLLVILAIVAICVAVVLGGHFAKSAQAATPNGCEVVGTVGNVIVARCIDDQTGLVVFANSAGFMQVAP